ncbi:MAG: TonB-dependent receptor [Acidobacteria bacterium]|nr:TonB-dependent receptor [Acidobacteriota bacterium]
MRSFRVALFAALLAPVVGIAGTLTIHGDVKAPDHTPVAGAHVEVAVATKAYTATTGRSGEFSIAIPSPPAWPLTVTVRAHAFMPVSMVLNRAPGALHIVLKPVRVFSEAVEVRANRATPGETPVTFSNVTRAEIERGSWGQDVPMFLSQVPGFYAYNDNGNGIGYSYFTLRGFDMRRTAVSLNGVPLNDAEEHGVYFIDLADFLSTTGSIQVQRGVGTNLYGGSAIGGSVDLRTMAPSPHERVQVSVLRGSWNTLRRFFQYDTGMSKNGWAATLRWSKIDTNGYRDQSWVHMWNYFATIEHYGRRSTLRLVLFGGPEDTHLAYDGISKAYLDGKITGNRRHDRRFNPLTYPGEVDHYLQPQEQLISTVQLSDTLTLQNTLYYFQGRGYYKQYKTNRWMPAYGLPPVTGPDGGTIDTTDLIRRRNEQMWDGGWIGQLQWRHDHGRATLQGGIATRLHRGRHYGEVLWAEHYPAGMAPNHRYYDYEVGKHTVQPFVQETWRVAKKWTIFGGATWTSHRYQMDHDRRKGVTFSETYTYFLPRFGVSWRPAKGWSLFANVSRGAREPAFRDIYDPQDYWAERTHLKKEKLTDYELGGERHWNHGFAKLNLYWLHFDNEIVWAGALDDSGVPITANGAVSNHRGIELESAWNPWEGWGAHLALSYSFNTFSRFTEYDWNGHPLDHSGNSIAGVPDWLGTLQLTGTAGPVEGLLTLRYVGRFYLDNTENLRKQPQKRHEPGFVDRLNEDFFVTNLSLRCDLGRRIADFLMAKRARLDLRINNLTDELYTTFGYMDGDQPAWTPAATRSYYLGLAVDW